MKIWEISLEVLNEGREPRYRRIDVEADTFDELAEKMDEVTLAEEEKAQGVVNVIRAERQA